MFLKTICLSIVLALSQNLLSQNHPLEFEVTEGDTTYTMKQYIFCMLKKGPNRGQDENEVKKIQDGHMNHLNKMADENKLIIAGPMGDDGELRGILIFDVKSVEEAQLLASKDPAIVSGRLVMEIHPWWAAKGSILK